MSADVADGERTGQPPAVRATRAALDRGRAHDLVKRMPSARNLPIVVGRSLHRAGERERVQVGRDRVGREPVREGRPRDGEREAAAAVADVHAHAALACTSQRRQHPPVVVDDGLRAAVEQVGDDVAGPQPVEDVVERAGRAR